MTLYEQNMIGFGLSCAAVSFIIGMQITAFMYERDEKRRKAKAPQTATFWFCSCRQRKQNERVTYADTVDKLTEELTAGLRDRIVAKVEEAIDET